MTRPITLRFQVREVGQRSVQITTRWAGTRLRGVLQEVGM